MNSLEHEERARDWLGQNFPGVSRETWGRIADFGQYLASEVEGQNLVAKASLASFWLRHVADSAQLLRFMPDRACSWLDLGSGAGFPGLIIAALSPCHVTLVEERRLRVSFLDQAIAILGVLDRTEVVGSPVQRMPTRAFDIISARAFAPLPRLLDLAHRFSTETTRWILPKGRSAQSELAQIVSTWHGDFRLEDSATSPDAQIIVAERVGRRGHRRMEA